MNHINITQERNYTSNVLTSIDFTFKGYKESGLKYKKVEVGESGLEELNLHIDYSNSTELYINTYTYTVPADEQYNKTQAHSESNDRLKVNDGIESDSGWIAKRDDIITKLEAHNG